MSRILGAFLFVALIWLVSDCQAQRHRGWFKRGFRAQQSKVQNSAVVDSGRHDSEPLFNRNNPTRHYNPSARYYDSRDSRRYYSAEEKYPKWIGGFHSSHFSNIGVPTGDLGFRGNGIYWTPW